MSRLIKWIVVALLFTSVIHAQSVSWYSQEQGKAVKINVLLFLSSSCPHCQQAESFFNALEETTADIQITKYFINQDKQALFLFNQLLLDAHSDDFAVPSIYFCNSRWVGFRDAESTGKDLLQAIRYCQAQIEKEGRLTTATIETLKHWAYANRFDTGLIGKPSPWTYIVSIAAFDAVTPCSLFILICFLAFIGLAKDKKTAYRGALFFIFIVLSVHYFQQTHTSSFYQMLPWLRLPALFTGVLGLFFVYRNVLSSLPGKKQTLIYWILTGAFAFLITAYQQTCIMNWAYVYQQWFNNQELPVFHAVFYQLMYQAIYAIPLLIGGFIYLFAFPGLRRFSFLMLGLCALLLMITPYSFAVMWVSLLVVGLALLGNYLLKRA